MKIIRYIAKTLAWIILAAIALVLLTLSLLYVPAVQDFIVPKVLEKINEGGDMRINVEQFRLGFPVDLTVKGVDIRQNGDTMLLAGEARVNVSLAPLIEGRVVAKDLAVDDIFFKSGTPDSISYIRANVRALSLDRVEIGLSNSTVEAGHAALSGGDINIALKNDTTPPTPPTDVPWRIDIESVKVTDVAYNMTMESSIESVGASLDNITLLDGKIDLADRNIVINDIEITKVNGKILTSPVAVAVPEAPADTFPSKPWNIAINKLRISESAVLYAMAGAQPQPGLDFNYIDLDNISVALDSFSMRGTSIHAPIAGLYASERSGLNLDARGLFEMDSAAIRAEGFKIISRSSEFDISAMYGLTADASEAPLRAQISADVAPADVALVMPSLNKVIAAMPRNRKMTLGVDLEGTLADLDLKEFSAKMPGYWDISAAGKLRDMDDLNSAVGNVDIKGNIINLAFAKPILLPPSSQKSIDIPPFKIAGAAKLNRGIIDGNVKVISGQGDIALDANWNNRRTIYDVDLDARQFPVNSFLPGMGIGNVTATARIAGEGLDIFNPKTRVGADINLVDAVYNNRDLHNLSLSATLSDGHAKALIASSNPELNMRVRADGNLFGETYNWTLDGDIANLDLEALGLTDTIGNVKMGFNGNAAYTPKSGAIDASLDLSKFDIAMGADRFQGADLLLDFITNDSLTKGDITNKDLTINFTSPESLDSLLARTDSISAVLNRSAEQRNLDVVGLHNALPQFALAMHAGPDNFVSDYLAESGTTFRNIDFSAANDTIISISAKADSICAGETRLDQVDFNAYQRDEYLRYRILVNNEPGTFDQFAKIQANGYIAENKLSLFLSQKNIQGKTGYNLGAMVTLRDSALMLKLVPYKPTIAYKPWTVNPDNYIIYNFMHPRIEANLAMENDESKLHLYTHTDSVAVDGTLSPRERLYVDIDNIKIQDWLALNPYSPPMTGGLSAKVNIGQVGKDLNGTGTVTLADFTYNKKRVGTFDLDLDLTTNLAGAIHANTSLSVDGVKTITASGNLNDSTSTHPFLLDFDMIHFPLAVANPFISTTGTLSGYLNGKMDVIGSLDSPRFNGYIDFDSAAVKVSMLGSSFNFDSVKIPVDSNVVQFNDFKVFGSNANPLAVNGTVDLRHLTDIAIDLGLKADNMQVVNSKKSRKSDVYGKAFISLDGSVKGNLNFMNVNANVTVNSGTNVTYIIPDATAALASRSNSDMVKFVNFNDTANVASADTIAPPSGAINVNAMLSIQRGATIGVDLAQTGNDRVQILPTGTLDYSLNPLGQSRVTGRINLEGGYARYTPPLMSEKMFDIEEGSYVSFTGDMMNPQLHLLAVDKLMANVTQEGQNSRLIYFDVSLAVNGTLEQMDIKFDLSTDDDITVENELQSMSPEQRANQAMNMLLYNTYTGPNTKATSNLGGNLLYSFLESTVNSWMANNIKGVDISFGIDQYQRTLGGDQSTATSYSYKVSKSFLDDRIKIVVGGNYSTDTDPNQSISESLINDVSIEYYINNAGTMYIRLFRHTGYESILEGEITQTGVGFVYKRKLNKFRYLFNFLKPKRGKKEKAPLKTVEIINPSDEMPD